MPAEYMGGGSVVTTRSRVALKGADAGRFLPYLLNLVFWRLVSRQLIVAGAVTKLHLAAQVAEQITQNGNGQQERQRLAVNVHGTHTRCTDLSSQMNSRREQPCERLQSELSTEIYIP
jgi:hypothetical protein